MKCEGHIPYTVWNCRGRGERGAITKCALHKSRPWEYENEWRLVDYSTRNYLVENITSINYKPTAIYYGVHISNENKERLHKIAKAKGIAEFDMYIDYSSPKYEMMYKSHKSSSD